MNKELKEAIERLKNTDIYNLGHDDRFEELRLYENAIDVVLEEIIKLQKENQELKDIKNKAIGHINCCKTSLGNYVLSPSEVECLLDILKEGDIE